MLGAILPALTLGLVSGGLGFLGQQNANNANRQMANAQMAFQQGSLEQQMAYNAAQREAQENFQREMFANEANFNAWQGDVSRSYTTAMSNTAYQRAMADMKAAGLNPLLAYQQGGASTPTATPARVSGGPGASASVGTAQGATARMENVMSPAVANALQAANVIMGAQQAAATIDQTKANTDLLRAQQLQAEANTSKMLAETIGSKESAELMRLEQRWAPALRGAQTAEAASSAQRHQAETRWIPDLRNAQTDQARQAAGLSFADQAKRLEETTLLRRYGDARAIGEIFRDVGGGVGGLSRGADTVLRGLR